MAASLSYDAHQHTLFCAGDLNLAHFPELKISLQQIRWPAGENIIINGEKIAKMDSAGAWLLLEAKKIAEEKKNKISWQGFSEEYRTLLKLIDKEVQDVTLTPPTVTTLSPLARLGLYTTQGWQELCAYLAFVGRLTFETLRIGFNPKMWRWPALITIVYRNGYQALPIIALLSFMIGVVLTYQMGLQLRNYGANIFIVDLLGLSVLREFGPLLTAIMVAGRTGSSYTAQLGIMKINQEIDALDTMGVTPSELLLLPRIIGLVIALPLLTMWADIFGVIGGMVMANNLLSISWYDFLHRFPNVIPLRALLIGIGKAPVFALIISSIGCFQGMQVRGSADSVGQNTTRSVVLAIFFIIVADAIFSVIFSKLKL